MLTARPFQKARTVNATDTDFPSSFAGDTTVIDPAFDVDAGTATGAVIKRLSGPGGGGHVPCAIDIFPYGTGADDSTFALRVLGYRFIGLHPTDGRKQYLKYIAATIGVTISTAVGKAGFTAGILDTERFADALTITHEGTFTADVTRTGSILLYNTLANTPAHAVVPLPGCEGYQIEWDIVANTTGMNALISFLHDLKGY